MHSILRANQFAKQVARVCGEASDATQHSLSVPYDSSGSSRSSCIPGRRLTEVLVLISWLETLPVPVLLR